MTRCEIIDDWLTDQGFGHLVELFRDNEIDEIALPDLTEAHLKELGLAMGTRIKLAKAIAELSPSKPAKPAT
jgi:hypothetical protein